MIKMNKYNYDDIKDFIDSVGEFQIIDLYEMEMSFYELCKIDK